MFFYQLAKVFCVSSGRSCCKHTWSVRGAICRHTGNDCVCVPKFRVYESIIWGMCFWENSHGRREHVESCSSTTKTTYSHWHDNCSHQTWQNSDLAWGGPPIKSDELFITRSCEVTWQTITIISPLTCDHKSWQDGDLLWGMGGFTLKVITLESYGLATSRDKLKPWYIYHQNAYGNQTWQDGGLPWGAPTQSHMTLLLSGFTRSNGKLKTYLYNHIAYIPPNLAGWRHIMRFSHT